MSITITHINITIINFNITIIVQLYITYTHNYSNIIIIYLIIKKVEEKNDD